MRGGGIEISCNKVQKTILSGKKVKNISKPLNIGQKNRKVLYIIVAISEENPLQGLGRGISKLFYKINAHTLGPGLIANILSP